MAGSSVQTGDMYQRTAERYVRTWVGLAVSALLVTSLLGCVLSFHNVVSRYLFTDACGGTVPSLLGRQNLRHRTPVPASTLLVIFLLVVTNFPVSVGEADAHG
ncbi:amino acid permease [Streptomyces sp. UC4497]